MTQPTGTSPASPAARASSSAISMKVAMGTVMAGLVPAIHAFVRCGV
jgi:hypothetical protein